MHALVSDSEIRLVVSPLEADISESESPAASARSKRGTRPGRPLEAGGARSKLGAPARSGRLPASVLRPSAALNAVAGRDAEPRPLLGAPAPRCRHTEALWPPPRWQCARKAAPLSAKPPMYAGAGDDAGPCLARSHRLPHPGQRAFEALVKRLKVKLPGDPVAKNLRLSSSAH